MSTKGLIRAAMEHIEIDESRLEAEVKAITQNANLDDVTVKDLRTRVEQVLGVTITDKNMFAGIVKRVLSQASQVCVRVCVCPHLLTPALLQSDLVVLVRFCIWYANFTHVGQALVLTFLFVCCYQEEEAGDSYI
jgi:hypothetical protein